MYQEHRTPEKHSKQQADSNVKDSEGLMLIQITQLQCFDTVGWLTRRTTGM